MQHVTEICYSADDAQAAMAYWKKLEFKFLSSIPAAGASVYERKGVQKQLPETFGGAPVFVLNFTKD